MHVYVFFGLKHLFEVSVEPRVVRSLAVKTDIIEVVLKVAVRYMEVPSATVDVNRRLIFRLLVPNDTVSEVARVSIKHWLDLICIQFEAFTRLAHNVKMKLR